MSTEPAPLPRIAVSAREAAEMLGVSKDSIYRLIDAGHLARVPHLTVVRIAVSELHRFAEGGA